MIKQIKKCIPNSVAIQMIISCMLIIIKNDRANKKMRPKFHLSYTSDQNSKFEKHDDGNHEK